MLVYKKYIYTINIKFIYSLAKKLCKSLAVLKFVKQGKVFLDYRNTHSLNRDQCTPKKSKLNIE